MSKTFCESYKQYDDDDDDDDYYQYYYFDAPN